MTAPKLVPELACSDLDASVAFYVGVLGFGAKYTLPEIGFAYLEREGVELMLDHLSEDSWLTGEMTRPFGRGINFQIEVSDVAALRESVGAAGIEVYRDMEDAWYRTDDLYTGNQQFLVQDPDGYLLRLFQDLGRKANPQAGPGVRIVG